MFIKYRIIDKNVDDHSILVRYYTDTISEDGLANSFDEDNKIIRTKDGYPVLCRTDTNITVYKTDSTEKEIDELIQTQAPVQWFKLQSDIKNPLKISALNVLKIGDETKFVYEEPKLPTPLPITAEEDLLSDEEIDKLLETLTTQR